MVSTNKTNTNSDQDQRRKTRLLSNNQISQRCVILLLTTCKTCVQYPQCPFAANNRAMLLKQMQKSLNYIQELLLKQYAANILGFCTISTTNLVPTNLPLTLSTNEDFFTQSSFHLNPTTIKRSIPSEQIYFPFFYNGKYLKQTLYHPPFFNSNLFDYNNNFHPSNQLRFYNSNQPNRAGTLLTNENFKLINISNFRWLEDFLSNDIRVNGARQSTSNYHFPPFNNLYFDEYRFDNRTNYLNQQLNSNKYLPIKHSLNFQDNDKSAKSSPVYLLPKRENISRTTNYSNSTITNGSENLPLQFNDKIQGSSGLTEPYSSINASIITDGLGSRSAGSHFSPCLPYYSCDCNTTSSPNNSFHPFNSLSYSNCQNLQYSQSFMHSLNVQHQYLLCQLQNLQKQQYQYYDNIYTSVFYNNDIDPNTSVYKTDQCLTIYNLLCSFEELISLSRLTCHSQAFRERISQCLDLGADLLLEFTDSPYTSHKYREKIILLKERVLLELNQLLRIGSQMMKLEFNRLIGLSSFEINKEKNSLPTDNLEAIIAQILRTCAELKQQLQQATLEQAHLLFKHSNPYELLNRLRSNILFGDNLNYSIQIDLYIEHYEHLRDTVKQLHHIAPTQEQQIKSKHAHFCVSIFAPMLLNSIQILINHFNSKINSEMSLTNFQAFFDFWIQLYIDIYDLFCLIVEHIGLREKENYFLELPIQTQSSTFQQQQQSQTSLHTTTKTSVQTANNSLAVPLNVHETTNSITDQKYQIPKIVEPNVPNMPSIQQKSDSKLIPNSKTPSNYCANCCTCEQSRISCTNRQNGFSSSQMDELARKRSLEENEIVEKCKTMTQLVQTMIEFTNGNSEIIKTTQDLFTHAESFGEEANKFYKIVRYLTYQIPSGQLKKDLLKNLDKVPLLVQELMFTVKNSTIGTAATFTKVDSVFNQVKQLLTIVQNTSHISIQCAKRYNLDLETINSGRISPMFSGEETGVRSRTDARRKQAQQSGSDSRRTRVSFLLF